MRSWPGAPQQGYKFGHNSKVWAAFDTLTCTAAMARLGDCPLATFLFTAD